MNKQEPSLSVKEVVVFVLAVLTVMAASYRAGYEIGYKTARDIERSNIIHCLISKLNGDVLDLKSCINGD